MKNSDPKLNQNDKIVLGFVAFMIFVMTLGGVMILRLLGA